MTVLAIETATAVCAAAVVRNGKPIGAALVEAPHVHSEKLMFLIDEALRTAALGLAGVDGIAVSIGPGSFTGLRIGLSVAKGLAYASGKPLIPVLTLEALAMRALHESLPLPGGVIMPMIDARRSEVYVALYRPLGGTPREVVPARAAHLHELSSLVPDDGPVVVMGDGADKFGEYLKGVDPGVSSRFVIPRRDLRLCSAVAVGLLGERDLDSGLSADAAALEPAYVKDFQSLASSPRLEAHS